MTDDPNQFELFPNATAGGPAKAAPKPTKTAVVSCMVIPFPLVKRKKKIISTAKTYSARKTKAGKDRFWNQTINGLHAQLLRHGASEDETNSQLEAFREAVSLELSEHHNQQKGSAK